jgi:hypothetical protein
MPLLRNMSQVSDWRVGPLPEGSVVELSACCSVLKHSPQADPSSQLFLGKVLLPLQSRRRRPLLRLARSPVDGPAAPAALLRRQLLRPARSPVDCPAAPADSDAVALPMIQQPPAGP